jgi:hypothetical protein
MEQSKPGPGWYPAPDVAGQLRWWDGRAWSGYYQLPAYPSPRRAAIAERPRLAPETAVYNWAMWAATLLPFAAGLLEVLWYPTFHYRYVVAGSQRSLVPDATALLTPSFFIGFVLVFVAAYAAWGLSVWFAYVDWKRLERLGVVRPFHWAWTFLSPAIYCIGRSVIVFTVARPRGLAPVWVFAGATLVTSILLVWKAATVFSAVSPMFSA